MIINFLVLQRNKEFVVIEFRQILSTYNVQYKEYKHKAVVDSSKVFGNYKDAKEHFEYNRKIFESLGYSLVRDAYDS